MLLYECRQISFKFYRLELFLQLVMAREIYTGDKMGKINYLILGAIALIFVGCSNPTPKCSDKETKDLVIDIAKDELKEQGMESLIPQLKFEIETIRTTKYDKNIDRYECAADFKMIGNANTTTLPITYTVESTDKKGEFYVTVDGF